MDGGVADATAVMVTTEVAAMLGGKVGTSGSAVRSGVGSAGGGAGVWLGCTATVGQGGGESAQP